MTGVRPSRTGELAERPSTARRVRGPPERRDPALEELIDRGPHARPSGASTGRCWTRWPAWPGDGTDVIDLKVADTALAEMAEAFRVFQPPAASA